MADYEEGYPAERVADSISETGADVSAVPAGGPGSDQITALRAHSLRTICGIEP